MAITRFAMRHKRLVSLLLIVCVVFFNIYGLQQQANAFVLTATAGLLIAVGVTMLIALGLTFSSSEAAHTAAEAFVTDCHDQVQNAIDTGKVVYNAVADDQAETGGYYYDVDVNDADWQTYVDWVHSHFTAGNNVVQQEVNNPVSSIYGYNLTIADGEFTAVGIWSGQTTENTWKFDVYKDSQYSVCDVYKNGVLFTHEIATFSMGAYYRFIGVTESNIEVYRINSVGTQSGALFRVSDVTSAYTVETESVDTGVYANPEIYNDVSYDWANSGTGERELAVDVYPAPAEAVGDITLTDGTGLVVDEEKTCTDAIGKTADWVTDKDLAGVPELTDTVVDTADSAVDDYATAENVMASDETATSLKGLLVTKFPFCIPWDIANAFKLIAAPPEAPHFEIDFLSQLPIDFVGSTTIEFDMADFPLLGQVSRWCATVEFCICLAVATRKLIRA